MHSIKFTIHSFAFAIPFELGIRETSFHVVDVDSCVCESGILIASVRLRSQNCSLFFFRFSVKDFCAFFFKCFQFLNSGFVTQTHTVHLKEFRIFIRTDFQIKCTLIQFHFRFVVSLFRYSHFHLWKCFGCETFRKAHKTDGWNKDWILNAMFTRVNKLNAF